MVNYLEGGYYNSKCGGFGWFGTDFDVLHFAF
jgi:hypothetical protein